jgi:hypothetical protein
VHVTGVKTQAQFAKLLKIKPQSVEFGVQRPEGIPHTWVVAVAEKTRCRIEWLESGEEPICALADEMARLVYDMQEFLPTLTPTGRDILLHCAQLLG